MKEFKGVLWELQSNAKESKRRKGAKKKSVAPLLRQQGKQLSPSLDRAIIRPRGRRCLRQLIDFNQKAKNMIATQQWRPLSAAKTKERRPLPWPI